MIIPASSGHEPFLAMVIAGALLAVTGWVAVFTTPTNSQLPDAINLYRFGMCSGIVGTAVVLIFGAAWIACARYVKRLGQDIGQ